MAEQGRTRQDVDVGQAKMTEPTAMTEPKMHSAATPIDTVNKVHNMLADAEVHALAIPSHDLLSEFLLHINQAKELLELLKNILHEDK